MRILKKLMCTKGTTVIYFIPELCLNKEWYDMLLGSIYCEPMRAFVVDDAHTVKEMVSSA